MAIVRFATVDRDVQPVATCSVISMRSDPCGKLGDRILTHLFQTLQASHHTVDSSFGHPADL